MPNQQENIYKCCPKCNGDECINDTCPCHQPAPVEKKCDHNHDKNVCRECCPAFYKNHPAPVEIGGKKSFYSGPSGIALPLLSAVGDIVTVRTSDLKEYQNRLLTSHNERLVKEIEGMRKGVRFAHSEESLQRENVRVGYNQALDDILALLNKEIKK